MEVRMRVRETVEGPCEYTISLDLCYSSVKYKSISLNCSTKIIKSAPKLNRSTCANNGQLGKGSWTFKPSPPYPRIQAPSNEHKVYKVSIYLEIQFYSIYLEKSKSIIQFYWNPSSRVVAVVTLQSVIGWKVTEDITLLYNCSC